jgi:hypothetical protein
LDSLLIGAEAIAEMSKEVVYSRHQNGTTGVKQSHSNILYTDPIPPMGSDNLYIEYPTKELAFSSNRVYGLQIYVIGSVANSHEVDYRMYSGAVKNVGGTVSIVGTGFTEITLAQDTAIWVTLPTFSIAHGTLVINIASNTAGDSIAVAARVEIISDGLI